MMTMPRLLGEEQAAGDCEGGGHPVAGPFKVGLEKVDEVGIAGHDLLGLGAPSATSPDIAPDEAIGIRGLGIGVRPVTFA